MTAKRISELTVIAGADTANDDNLVIFDTSASTTKRILRSQLAAGLVGDLPYTPSGGIAATTIPTAISELDTEAAKKASAQTFTAAQTFRAASAVRSEVAATQDAVVIAGRAGGTLSYAVTLTPTTLSANRTITLPNGDATLTAGTSAVLGTAQTFTAQQTLTSGLVLQSATAASIAAVANAINTTSKAIGKVVFDTTNNRLMVASGTAAASPWYVADGSASVTPA
jgi:hypothetical protein